MYKCLGNQVQHLFKPKTIYFLLSHSQKKKIIMLPLNLYNEFGLSDCKENMTVLQTLLFTEKTVFTKKLPRVMSNHKLTVYPKSISSLVVSCRVQVILIFVYKNVTVNSFNGIQITA
jgi:hypothetical protein